MKTPDYIQLTGATCLILTISIFTGININAQSQTNLQAANTVTIPSTNNLPPPPPGFATRLDYIKSFTNDDDALGAYRKGLIGNDEALWAHYLIGNSKSQDFYGRVIDQYGQPVTNAEVVGNLVLEHGWYTPEEFYQYKTRTDAGGLFQFTGLHGAQLGVVPNKPGYELAGHGEGFKRAVAQQSSLNDRATFIMWKLRGAEPMMHNEFQSRVPYDGTSVTFNLTTGKKAVNGDLRITVSRFPSMIRRGRDKYDWTAKIEMLNGGIVLDNDPYPNWAPNKGYLAFFETSMSSNNVPWSGELRQNYYITNSQRQFGRVFIDLSTDSMRIDTGITIRTWINPSGSQNLEFDPKMQMRKTVGNQ